MILLRSIQAMVQLIIKLLYDSNTSTNKMQQSHKFITWSLCVAQHVSGRLPTHHQEHTTALGASGFTVGQKRLERCWSWSGRLRPTTLQPLLSNRKTRGSLCSCMLLMMDGETPETCWATQKRQVINLWDCCILLVELFESYDDARNCECKKNYYSVT